ncbi:cytochrome P450, partial [Streptomyces sp. NPDC049577]
MTARGAAVARRRDRRVYRAGHPLLFALLAAARRAPVVRVGRAVLVHEAGAFRQALTRVPLDRTAAGTTGRAAHVALGGEPGPGVLFDQQGAEHRAGRRELGDALSAAGVERLRPVWSEVLARGLAPLAAGREVDVVPLAQELAGATAGALLGVDADPRGLAVA